tara:strand:- start:405 stop:629 length:225 start_codon:yes stop_codon:yes gene_type:complete
MPTIVHFREECIGCNSCVEYASGYWKISDEDGKSVLIRGKKKGKTHVLPITKDELKENELAARDCPVKIIKIFK